MSNKNWVQYIKENYSYLLAQDEDGKWITLDNGRHVFIEEGESLEDAMGRQKIPFLGNMHLRAEMNIRVDKVLKAKGFTNIKKHIIEKNGPAMQIKVPTDSNKKVSFGINTELYENLNKEIGSEDTRTVYNFSIYHELGHLEQLKEDPNMGIRYNSSRKEATYYENDADKRAEKYTGIKRNEVDDIMLKALENRKTRILKSENDDPYSNFLRDDVKVGN